jgi:hypothetical protein
MQMYPAALGVVTDILECYLHTPSSASHADCCLLQDCTYSAFFIPVTTVFKISLTRCVNTMASTLHARLAGMNGHVSLRCVTEHLSPPVCSWNWVTITDAVAGVVLDCF